MRKGLVAVIFIVAVCWLDAYETTAPWPDGVFRYWVNPVNASGIPEADVAASAQRAATNWDRQTDGAVRTQYMGLTTAVPKVRDGQNVIGFFNESNTLLAEAWSWYRYDGSVRVAKLEVDIYIYEGNHRFIGTDDGCTDQRYLEDVLTHEIGHALGLGHSAVNAATMYKSVGANCSMKARSLDADDLAGITALYGSGPTIPTVPTPAPSSGVKIR